MLAERGWWARGPYLAVVLEGKIKGEARDALGLCAGGDLQALDDARVALVLEAGVLAFGVLADDGKVDAGMAGGEAGEGLAEDDGGVDVELLAHGDVPRDVAGLGNGGEEDACTEGAGEVMREATGGRTRKREREGAPLRPTLLRFKLSIACLKRSSPDEDMPETSYWSHSMGALTYSKISLTESVISAPIPSPGMRVTWREQTVRTET